MFQLCHFTACVQDSRGLPFELIRTNQQLCTKFTSLYAARFLDFYYRSGLMHVGRIYTSWCFATCNTLYPLKMMACPLKHVGIMSM
jgi:hypothetical protein